MLAIPQKITVNYAISYFSIQIEHFLIPLSHIAISYSRFQTLIMASQPVPKLSELAALIAEKATYLECFLDDNNLPHPSFVPDGPSQFPVTSLQGEASAARFALIDAAKDLRNLVTGPKDTLRWIALNARIPPPSRQSWH